VVILTWQSTRAGQLGSATAMVIALIGTFCWSGGTLLSRKLALPASRVASAGWQMATGGFLLFLLAAVTGEGHRLPSAFAHWSPRIAIAMAYLILAASLLAFTAYVWLLGHEPMGRVASYAYVNPVVALALGAWLGNEHMTLLQIVGSVLVLAGVFATLTGKTSLPPAPIASTN
jgi:drug/metabolite transporter (DMT)-like permease